MNTYLIPRVQKVISPRYSVPTSYSSKYKLANSAKSCYTISEQVYFEFDGGLSYE